MLQDGRRAPAWRVYCDGSSAWHTGNTGRIPFALGQDDDLRQDSHLLSHLNVPVLSPLVLQVLERGMEEVEIFPLDPPGSDMMAEASENSAEEISSSDRDALPMKLKQYTQETCCGVCNSGASRQVCFDPGVVHWQLHILSMENSFVFTG